MLKTQAQIISDYSIRISEVTAQMENRKKRVDQLSFLRIGLFLAEILLFVLLLNSDDNGWRILVQVGLIIPVIVFAFVVKKQSALDLEIAYQKQLLWVYQNEWNQLNGLKNGYNDGSQFESELHPYTSDLDIFGNASLYSLLNRGCTKNGTAVLAKSLSEKVSKTEILTRQEAVKEILNHIEDTFDFRANLHGHDVEQIELIKGQLEHQLGGQLAFIRNSLLKFYIALTPYISCLLLLAGLFVNGVFWNVLTLYCLINIAWNVSQGSKINKVFYSFGGGSGLLNGYADAIFWTENHKWESSYLLSLTGAETQVSKEIKSLSKIIQNFDARLNIIVGVALNALLLWDLRCCVRLNKWHEASSTDVISALNHLGNFEEIISLATLAHNQAEWTFPDIDDAFSLKVEQIGHPLITPELRISNDFSVENIPTVDIVTGSNMAGKSTFLRTLGINMVLAYAGAPVCAKYMRLSEFSINTYMRIKDSLNENTSTFKAELNRLKMILDNVVNDKNTFVLIDEMLRGTNSRDKYLGSKVFVEKLIIEKTPALFATHDLQLADLKQTNENTLRNYHFDISINDGEMMFDYKLKNGPCETFNAAILLKEIGLTLD